MYAEPDGRERPTSGPREAPPTRRRASGRGGPQGRLLRVHLQSSTEEATLPQHLKVSEGPFLDNFGQTNEFLGGSAGTLLSTESMQVLRQEKVNKIGRAV